MFRKGKALGEQGFLDKALSVLEDLKKKSPGEDAMVDAEGDCFEHLCMPNTDQGKSCPAPKDRQ